MRVESCLLHIREALFQDMNIQVYMEESESIPSRIFSLISEKQSYEKQDLYSWLMKEV